ncbi:MAG: non-canonical purine NTP pyrophosphatase [Candidatus Eremiobacteraeota bacterium]|nr:non-canonical purine NTP pyrophosphatase [Candidatus Eremiobacteraeota bacterium]
MQPESGAADADREVSTLRDWRSIQLSANDSITVATKNFEKFHELKVLWGDFKPGLVVAGTSYPVVQEHGDSYEANAILKAATLAELCDGPALADDSGIEVEALGWGPGILSARTPWPQARDEQRNAHILEAVSPGNRAARFVCVCALVVPGFQPVLGRGEVAGEIAERPMGSSGFGYDPIFFYPPYGATFGQVEEARKHAVSHRGGAVRALLSQLAALVK